MKTRQKFNGTLPNTQRSAHADDDWPPQPWTHSDSVQAEHFVREANLQYAEIIQLQRKALVKAKLVGGYLNRVKPIVENKFCEDWLPYLQTHFKGSVRNAQNYMEIERRWDELEAEVARNPELSIDGALTFLRKESVIRKLTKTWTENEREWLRQEPEAFGRAMTELRNSLRRKYGELSLEERRARYAPCLERLQLLKALRDLLDAYVKQPDGILVPRPMHELV